MTEPYDRQLDDRPSDPPGAAAELGAWSAPVPGEVAPSTPGFHDAGAPYYLLPQPEQPAEPSRRRPLAWILAAATALLVLAGGGGAVAAYHALSGGGTQPEALVPANALAFAKLDLNPSASQKIAVARLLNRLPKGGSSFSATSDWRASFFDVLSQNASLPSGVSFDQDVKPWLGDRMAVAAVPAPDGGDPDTLVIAESRDEAKARAGVAHFDPGYGIDFVKGYAVIGPSQAVADRAVAAARAGSLQHADRFSTQMGKLGATGVGAGWFDLGALSKLDGNLGSLSGLPVDGQIAFTLRLSSNTAELQAKVFGATQLPPDRTGSVTDLGALPASTAIAIRAAVPAKAIDRQWSRLTERLGSLDGQFADLLPRLQQQFGITLPGDLDSLLGSEATVALDSRGLGGSDVPEFAVRTRTDSKAAMAVLDNLSAHLPPGTALHYRAAPDGVIAGTDDAYLSAILAPAGGRLRDVAGFGTALPDLSSASSAAFVNLDAIGAAMRTGGASAEDLRAVSAFRALGITMQDGAGVSTVRIRLVLR